MIHWLWLVNLIHDNEQLAWPIPAGCYNRVNLQENLDIFQYLKILLHIFFYCSVIHNRCEGFFIEHGNNTAKLCANPKRITQPKLILNMHNFHKYHMLSCNETSLTDDDMMDCSWQWLSDRWEVSTSPKCSSPILIARLMGPTWGPPGADRTQVGPMLAPWALLSK